MSDKLSPLRFQDETADRREPLRQDEAALAELARSEKARFLPVRAGRVRVLQEGGLRLFWMGHEEAGKVIAGGARPVFLGLLDGAPHFGLVPDEPPQTIANRPREIARDGDYVGLLQAANHLPLEETQLAAQALHLSNWINRTRLCGLCGGEMRSIDAGHKRECTQCGWHEFPRTDPVVITLVVKGDRCVLVRQPRMQPGFYAAVAGFVSPAETLEAAVRREVHEEVGLRVGAVRYVGSQPWPFPSSLMIGFIAEALDEDIVLDPGELEDARWFDRAEIAALCAAPPGADGTLHIPLPGVMARRLVELWALENPAAI